MKYHNKDTNICAGMPNIFRHLASIPFEWWAVVVCHFFRGKLTPAMQSAVDPAVTVIYQSVAQTPTKVKSRRREAEIVFQRVKSARESSFGWLKK